MPDLTVDAAWREFRAMVDTRLAGLRETLRIPLVYRCLENQSHSGTARQLGLQAHTLTECVAREHQRLHATPRTLACA
jgi:hypothetical protein